MLEFIKDCGADLSIQSKVLFVVDYCLYNFLRRLIKAGYLKKMFLGIIGHNIDCNSRFQLLPILYILRCYI